MNDNEEKKEKMCLEENSGDFQSAEDEEHWVTAGFESIEDYKRWDDYMMGKSSPTGNVLCVLLAFLVSGCLILGAEAKKAKTEKEISYAREVCSDEKCYVCL